MAPFAQLRLPLRVEAREGAARGPDTARERLSDYRLLREILDAERVALVTGIVARKDLEGWLRRHRGVILGMDEITGLPTCVATPFLAPFV